MEQEPVDPHAPDRTDTADGPRVEGPERDRAAEALRETDERFRGILDQGIAGIVFLDLDGHVLSANARFCEIVGCPSEAGLVGTPMEAFTHPDDLPAEAPLFARLVADGTPFQIEKRYVRPDGAVVWVDNTVAPVRGPDGRPRSVVALSVDVTERREAREALAVSAGEYRTLFTSMGEGFALCEVVLGDDGRPADYRVLDVNPAYETVVGLTREEVVGRTAREIVPNIEEAFVETYGRVVLDHAPARFESRMEGLGRWLDTYAFPVEPAGSGRFGVVLSDVTERKRTEEARHRSAARATFRATFTDALRPLSGVAEAQFVAARELGEHLGATRAFYSEVDADGLHVRIDRDYHAGVPSVAGTHRLGAYSARALDEYRAGRTVVQADVEGDARLTAEEKARYTVIDVRAFVSVPLIKDGRLAALLTVHQATARAWTPEEVALLEETAERTWSAVERRRAEAALRESEERYRTLFTTIDEGFALCEMVVGDDGAPLDYRFVEVNPAFTAMTGLPADSVGQTARELVPDLEDHWVETYGRAGLGREAFRFEQGSEAMGRWFDVYVSPVGPPEAMRFALVFMDVSERKRSEAEVRALNETLEGRVKERTRQVRQLAARLAVAEQAERQRIALVLHDDLQQQLYGLSMVLSLLGRAPAGPGVENLVGKATAILGDAVQMARTLATELSPSILQADRLRDVLEWVAGEKRDKDGLAVAVEVEGDPHVADPALRILLYQALREVLFNVVKHSGGMSARLVAWAEGEHAVVRVEDDGAGFDAQAAGDGRRGGFGLFSVRERLELVGGRFEVDSAPGKGTRITLAVPSGRPLPD